MDENQNLPISVPGPGLNDASSAPDFSPFATPQSMLAQDQEPLDFPHDDPAGPEVDPAALDLVDGAEPPPMPVFAPRADSEASKIDEMGDDPRPQPPIGDDLAPPPMPTFASAAAANQAATIGDALAGDDDHGLGVAPDSTEALDELIGAVPAQLAAHSDSLPSQAATLTAAPAESVQDILNEVRAELEEGAPLLMELGPFSGLNARLRSAIAEHPDAESAMTLATLASRIIHDAVTAHPGCNSSEVSKPVIEQRQKALSVASEVAQSKMIPLLARLGAHHKDALLPLQNSIMQAFRFEGETLESQKQSIVPATLGDRVFDKLFSAAQTAFEGNAPLTGDIRRHRDEQLTRALSDLHSVSSEINERSGDADWERSTGKQAVTVLGDLMVSVRRITKGVENQVNHEALQKTLRTVSDNLGSASKKTRDDEQKRLLEEAAAALAKLMQKIRESLAKFFGISAGTPTVPSGPRPVAP